MNPNYSLADWVSYRGTVNIAAMSDALGLLIGGSLLLYIPPKGNFGKPARITSSAGAARIGVSARSGQFVWPSQVLS